jgi:hypothetical protein
MALRTIYKDKDSKQCGFTEATRLVAEEGWSWTPSTTVKAKRTSTKAKKPKVKVEAEADVIQLETPFNDGNPNNDDFNNTDEEK